MKTREKSAIPMTAVLIILLAALIISILLAVTFGTVHIPFGDVYRVITHGMFGVGGEEFASGRIVDMIWLITVAACSYSSPV